MAERLSVPGVARRKLVPPSYTQDYVVRERLLQRLDEVTERRCTVVAAGPGYGKSVLLASWVEQQAGFDRVAWLSLDAFDADPPRLCAAVLNALQEPLRANTPAAGPLLRLRPTPAPPYQAFVDDALIPALESVGERMLLVVDDVHHLATSPAALAILDSLIRWAPQNLHFVLAGRADPPWRCSGFGSLTSSARCVSTSSPAPRRSLRPCSAQPACRSRPQSLPRCTR